MFLSIVLVLVVSFRGETNFSFESPKKDNESKEELPKEESVRIKLLTQATGEIKDLDLEEYIIGVVAAEMPASFEIEALKAQAVAARTFAMHKINTRDGDYDVIAGVADQAYNTVEDMQKKWAEKYDENYAKISNAVLSTKNEVMKYQGKVIEAFYFSMSNGKTENCDLVFQESLPYLVSVGSEWDNESLNNYEVTKTFSKDEFCSLLSLNCENLEINQIDRTDSNRIKNIVINNQSFTGVQIRKLLTLRSTDFDIELSDEIKITTRGNGHGVGMSQYGANGMAKDGTNYQGILNHYYQNIEILKI